MEQQNPLAYSGSYPSLIWQDTYSKHVQPEEFFMKSADGVPKSGQLQFSGTEQNVNPKFSDGLFGMLPIKGTTAKTATNPGILIVSVLITKTIYRALPLPARLLVGNIFRKFNYHNRLYLLKIKIFFNSVHFKKFSLSFK